MQRRVSLITALCVRNHLRSLLIYNCVCSLFVTRPILLLRDVQVLMSACVPRNTRQRCIFVRSGATSDWRSRVKNTTTAAASHFTTASSTACGRQTCSFATSRTACFTPSPCRTVSSGCLRTARYSTASD